MSLVTASWTFGSAEPVTRRERPSPTATTGVVEELVCEFCKVVFPHEQRVSGRRKRFCSEECSDTSYRRHTTPEQRKTWRQQEKENKPILPPPTFECEICFNIFTHHKRGGGQPKYCSRKCKNLKARLRLYGISSREYFCQLILQGGKCAICGSSGELIIDHNHNTGRARALLCSACNFGIGTFQEKQELLRSAIRYIDMFGGKAA